MNVINVFEVVPKDMRDTIYAGVTLTNVINVLGFSHQGEESVCKIIQNVIQNIKLLLNVTCWRYKNIYSIFYKNLLIKEISLQNLFQKSDISIYYQSLCFHEHSRWLV